jgi:type I restriction enzyme S subunit
MNKLPSGWEVITLKDYGYFFSGGTPLTNIKEFYKKEIPFITSSELNQKIIKKVHKYISKKGYENSSAKMIKKGDVLLALYGATAGVIAISEIDGAINQAVLCIRFNKKIDNKFFFYWFDLKKNYFVYKYTQGAQTNFSSEIIKNIKISIPKSLQEQQKIAEILSEVDKSIEITQKIIEKEKKIKRGLLQKMLNVTEKGEPEIRFKQN